MDRTYIAIDLKSFFASVECVERGFDPLDVNLVVADSSKTEKTICLAVSPSLKAHGISGRARLFEVIAQLKKVNAERLYNLSSGRMGKRFSGSSYYASELASNPSLSVDFVTAVPRMALYVKYSTRIYNVYLRHVAPEDIHVYSIDEVFIDATQYLKIENLSAREFAKNLISEVYRETGITATAGIGTNMYLCKVAMDIVAKHVEADKDGVRIAELDERKYRELLWNHRPLTDFWRVGKGVAKRLEALGLYTMGDVAKCSVGKPSEYFNEGLLYKTFGINAELLIDHAWGWEPCTIADVKAYKPVVNSVCSGQVLTEPYDYEKTRLVVKEMVDLLVLDLVEKKLLTDQIVLTVGYDIENKNYDGPMVVDFYGRVIPKQAHGTTTLKRPTSSTSLILDAVMDLYDAIIDKTLLCRRIYLTANRVVLEDMNSAVGFEQMDFFTDYSEVKKQETRLKREKSIQKTVINIKKKYGKNSILRGMNFKEGATAKERNEQIGGHKA